jgi:hypothetical protein
VLADYQTMIKRLYMYGIPVFIITGSFLSQHRDCGQWNANDHDLDLGIFAEDLYRLPGCAASGGEGAAVNNLIKHALNASVSESDRLFKCTETGLPYQLYESGRMRCPSPDKPP